MEIDKQVATGGDPVGERRAERLREERLRLTFADLLDEYIAERIGTASLSEVERELRKDALPALGSRRPAEITGAEIDAAARAILERGSAAMARRLIMHLKALFNFVIYDRPSLAERYGITSNPADRLGRRRHGTMGAYGAPRPRERFLDDGEITVWWLALESSHMRPGNRLALQLCLVTGQRQGEVRGIERSELRLDGPEPVWTIPGPRTKNKQGPHVVPLSPLVVRLLKQATKVEPGALLFPDPNLDGAPLGKTVLPTAQANFFREHLPDMRPSTVHDLRRTASTGMRRLGVPRDVVTMVLNQRAQGVTARHYDWHEGLAEKREALERWASHVEGLIAE